MWSAPALALTLALLVGVFAPHNLPWALPVVALWAISPALAYRTGLARGKTPDAVEAGLVEIEGAEFVTAREMRRDREEVVMGLLRLTW